MKHQSCPAPPPDFYCLLLVLAICSNAPKKIFMTLQPNSANIYFRLIEHCLLGWFWSAFKNFRHKQQPILIHTCTYISLIFPAPTVHFLEWSLNLHHTHLDNNLLSVGVVSMTWAMYCTQYCRLLLLCQSPEIYDSRPICQLPSFVTALTGCSLLLTNCTAWLAKWNQISYEILKKCKQGKRKF